MNFTATFDPYNFYDTPQPKPESLPSFEDFKENYTMRFGKSNPEIMNNPYWIYMAQNPIEWARDISYQYRKQGCDLNFVEAPIYTHFRAAAADVVLPNGDLIRIGGEHEDSYDPHFCIYNDIVKYGHDGEITIYGYPEEVFSPTYSHSAIYVPSQDAIYIVGGYQENREDGNTLVYKLNLDTFAIECVPTTGAKPGWISDHKSQLLEGHNAVFIYGGEVTKVNEDGKKEFVENTTDYRLDLDTLEWEVGVLERNETEQLSR